MHEHLARGQTDQSCFLNRNSADFENPSLVAELQALGCKILPAFDQGLSFVRGMLDRN